MLTVASPSHPSSLQANRPTLQQSLFIIRSFTGLVPRSLEIPTVLLRLGGAHPLGFLDSEAFGEEEGGLLNGEAGGLGVAEVDEDKGEEAKALMNDEGEYATISVRGGEMKAHGVESIGTSGTNTVHKREEGG